MGKLTAADFSNRLMSMSVRGTGKGAYDAKKKRKSMLAVLFWLIFFIVILLLFIINLPLIRGTLKSTHIVERLTNRPITADQTEEEAPPAGEETPPGIISVVPPPAAEIPSVPDTALSAVPETAGGETAETTGMGTDTGTESIAAENIRPQNEESPPASRERVIYFVKIDNSGLVFTSPVKRRVFVSDSPLLDVLNLMLQGPAESEQKQGLTSLIPEGARIQNIKVTGNTAVVSFNENFMFNSYGVEGYIAQLRQIIWTATEFPNVSDVQILIDGRRVDFLGESIRINRPLGRDSL
jgi:spore germination protein GerM